MLIFQGVWIGIWTSFPTYPFWCHFVAGEMIILMTKWAARFPRGRVCPRWQMGREWPNTCYQRRADGEMMEKNLRKEVCFYVNWNKETTLKIFRTGLDSWICVAKPPHFYYTLTTKRLNSCVYFDRIALPKWPKTLKGLMTRSYIKGLAKEWLNCNSYGRWQSWGGLRFQWLHVDTWGFLFPRK